MASSLSALAPEMVDLIAAELELMDLLSIRLTCQALYIKSLSYFKEKYLRKATTDLSYTSLKKLENLSNSGWASQHVTMLRLQGLAESGQGYTWDRDASSMALQTTLPPIVLLRDILTRLPNCTSFHVSGPCKDNETVSPTNELSYSDLMGIAFFIIADTGRRVTSFHAETKFLTKQIIVNVNRMHLDQWRNERFQKAWAHNEELYLNFSPSSTPYNWTWDLVEYAPNLRKLVLDNTQRAPPRFLEDFAACKLPGIQELWIQASVLTERSLIMTLEQLQDSIQILMLKRVGLKANGKWISIFQFLHEHCSQLEKACFERLVESELDANDQPKMHVVSFSRLNNNKTGFVNTIHDVEQGQSLEFKHANINRTDEVDTVSYSGADVQIALKRMVSNRENQGIV